MFTVTRRHFTHCDVRARPGLPASLVGPALAASFLVALVACSGGGQSEADLVAEGKQTFRYDTFGDETKWTDVLRMNEVISTVDPTTALAVGLKVDSEALPPAVVTGIQNGSISLTDPATTLALLKLDAVVGVKGTVRPSTARTRSPASASPAPCAIRPWTTRSLPASESGSTAGPIAISTSGQSSRCPLRSTPRRRRSSTAGAREGTTRDSTWMARTGPRSSRPPTDSRTAPRHHRDR